MRQFTIKFSTNAFDDMPHLSPYERRDLIKTMIQGDVLDLRTATGVEIVEVVKEPVPAIN